MVTIGWLEDKLKIRGGAGITSEMFRAQTPKAVTIRDCPSWQRPPNALTAFVIQNCVTYDPVWINVLEGKPVVWHVHDLAINVHPELRRWLLDSATLLVFNSPMQLSLFPFGVRVPTIFVPPPIRLAEYERAKEGLSARRNRAIWIGRLDAGKGVARVVDWALQTRASIDFYGWSYDDWTRRQVVSPCRYCGPARFDEMPGLLANYRTFVHMPINGDLCGRSAIEALAAGCKMELRGDTKAFWAWADLKACDQAAETWWREVMRVIE